MDEIWILSIEFHCDLCIPCDDFPVKTTFDLPEGLLEDAVRCSGARTKREAVMQALKEFTRRAKLDRLADRLGDSETFMSYEELMEHRTGEEP